MKRVMTCGAAVVFALFAQETKPSCNHCSATYISTDELQVYLKRAPARIVANDVSDQQVRAVDIGRSHVDIGVVYRRTLSGESPVAEHDLVSEVYHIIDGSATLVTGPSDSTPSCWPMSQPRPGRPSRLASWPTHSSKRPKRQMVSR